MKSFTKLNIASIQLRRALVLYVESDYISALTLAGAADDILGVKLKLSGRQNALESDVELLNVIHRKNGDTFTDKEIKEHRNFPKNQAKHLGKADMVFTEAYAQCEAENMIDRAAHNYLRIFNEWPDFDNAYRRYHQIREANHQSTRASAQGLAL